MNAIEHPDSRRARRQHLVGLRQAVGAPVRAQVQQQVAAVLELVSRTLRHCGRVPRIACYWPIRGEPGLGQALAAAVQRGDVLALPFIPGPAQALQFRRWQPGAPTIPGIWNIPTPAVDERVQPNVVLAPVVGFDAAWHRLGNGGGYYDRSFAALPAATLRLGVGFDCLRLPSICPEPHDIPMHAVITESLPAFDVLAQSLSALFDGSAPA
jgi:5,10-methenyltetrahydrofolate synthetase